MHNDHPDQDGLKMKEEKKKNFRFSRSPLQEEMFSHLNLMCFWHLM